MAQGIEYFPNFDKVLGVETATGKLVVNDKKITFPASDATLARTDAAQTFTGAQTFANMLTGTNVGTVTTSATTVAEEHGDGVEHVTKLTMTAFAVGTSDNAADLASGAKFYTFPAGSIFVTGMTMVGSLTGAMTTKTDTPEVGVGSVIGSGAVAVLSGTATFEEYINGNVSATGGDTVAPDVDGTTFYKAMSDTTGVVIKTSGGKSHDLFLNIADGWVAEADAAITFTGVITIKWRIVS